MLCSLLFDVEWNKWVWNHDGHYKVIRTVSSKCDSKFTLGKEAPKVDVVDTDAFDNKYSIKSAKNDKGVFATGSKYTFAAKNC